MRYALKQAVRVYVYLSLLFSIVFWIYLIIDDYVLIEKYWFENWLEYLLLWIVYFLIYFAGFSFYFWIAAFTGVLIYHFLIRRTVHEK